MGSKGGGGVDYEGNAERQNAADFRNMEYQTRANRPNMYTPAGSSVWDDLGNGSWANTITMSPDMRRAYDAQMDIAAQRSEMGQSMMGQAYSDMQTPDNFWGDLPDYNYSPGVSQYDRGNYQPYQNVDTSGYGQEFRNVGGTPGRWEDGPAGSGFDPNAPQGAGPAGGEYLGMGGSWIPGTQGRRERVINAPPSSPNQTTFSSQRDPNADPQNLYGLSDVNAEYDPRFETAMYDRAMSLLRPEQEEQSAAARTRLANMGLSQGGEAFDDSVKDLREYQGEETQRVAWDSILRGAEEYDRDFQRQLAQRGQQFGETSFSEQQRLAEQGQDYGQQLGIAGFEEAQRAARFGEQRDALGLQFQEAAMANAIRNSQGQEDLAFGGQAFQQGFAGAGMNNQVRQQQIVDQMQREGWSLNKINAFLSGQQVGMPGFQDFNTAGYVKGPDYMGAGQQQNQYDMSVNNMWGNLGGGLAGGLFG